MHVKLKSKLSLVAKKKEFKEVNTNEIAERIIIMAFWKRLTSCISSHATSLLSRFEDPILKTERALSLLKDLQAQSFDSLARVKALIITTEEDVEARHAAIEDFESKVIELYKKVNEGSVSKEQADALASSIVSTKLKYLKEEEFLKKSLDKYRKLEEKLEAKSIKIKQQIKDCEFQLTALKSRMSVASTLKEISRSTNGLNDDSVNSLLKETESKVRNEEALATAYDSMEEVSVEDQVDAVIGSSEQKAIQAEVERLKAKADEN